MVGPVQLDVGRCTCVEPDQLVTTYDAAVKGTWLDGSRLTITEIPFVGRCLICNGTYPELPLIVISSFELNPGRELPLDALNIYP